MALAVEVAVEAVIELVLYGGADGGEVIWYISIIFEVVHHLEVFVAETVLGLAVRAVHAGGQEVELLGGVNKVGRLPAFAVARPFNGVVGGDGDIPVGHG